MASTLYQVILLNGVLLLLCHIFFLRRRKGRTGARIFFLIFSRQKGIERARNRFAVSPVARARAPDRPLGRSTRWQRYLHADAIVRRARKR